MKKLVFLLAMLICFNAYAGNQWRAGTGADSIVGTTNISDIDAVSFQNIVDPLDRVLANLQEGCKISYASASTITVAAGEIVIENSDGSIRLMQQNTSATTVAWTDIDTGSEASGTTYYLYAYQATVTETDFDIAISLSSSAPSGITYYARLGSFYNNSSGNIEQISNDNESTETSYILGQGSYYKTDSGSSASVGAVSFSFTFDSAPVVVLGLASQPTGDNYQFYVTSVTTTGFTITNYSGLTASNNWVAIGQYKL